MNKQLNSICILIVLLFTAAVAMGQQIDYRKVGAPLPDIKIIDRAGITFTKTDITEDRNFFLVMFNPTCGHCVDVAKVFRDNKIFFDDNTVMFMSAAETMVQLPAFAGQVDWEDGANMILGEDHADCVKDLYNHQTVPQVNIYDASLQLIKTFNGTVSMKDLEVYIK